MDWATAPVRSVDFSSQTPAEGPDGFCEYSSCKESKCWRKAHGVSRFCPCTLAQASVNEDEWSEQSSDAPWSELQLLAGKEAVTSDKCGALITQETCEAAGCFFDGEEGMAICTKTKNPLAP